MRLNIWCLVQAVLVVGLLGAPLQPSATATPAQVAQECDAFDLRDRGQVRAKVAEADTIFQGRVMRAQKRQRPGAKPDFVHIVEVQVVYAGVVSAGQRIEVVTARPADDGLGRLERRARYLFFTQSQSGDTVLAKACGGTTELGSKGFRGAARTTLIEVLAEQSDEPGARVTLDEPANGTASPPSLGRAAAPGVAIVLVGVLGLLLVLGLGARRS